MNCGIGICHIVQYQCGAKVPWTPTVMPCSPSLARHPPPTAHELVWWGIPQSLEPAGDEVPGQGMWHREPVGHSRVRGGGEDVGPGPLFSAASGTQAQLRGAAARPAGRASTPSTAGTAAGQCQLQGGACAASGPIHPRSCCSTTLLPLCHCPLAPDQGESGPQLLLHAHVSAGNSPLPVCRTPRPVGSRDAAWCHGCAAPQAAGAKGLGRVRGKTHAGARSMTGPCARTPHPVQSARLGHGGARARERLPDGGSPGQRPPCC